MEYLTDLRVQIPQQVLDKALIGQVQADGREIVEAYFWSDGEETVCDQLDIRYSDGKRETCYGFDAMDVLDKYGLKYKMDNGRDVSHLWN